MAARRERRDVLGAGVVLRDGSGVCYVIPAMVLRRYRVPEELAGALMAFLAGDDVAGLGAGPVGEAASVDARARTDAVPRALARVLDAFQRSRTGHLSVTAATWLLR